MATGAQILLGTTKGAFILTEATGAWQVDGPHCDGMPINHMIGDPASGDIWAAGGGGWFPVGVWRRAPDGGWTFSGDGFPEAVQELWSLALASERLLAGSKPAELFESRDGGATWQHLPALTQQNGADDWMPGGAGLTLHTILTDPDPGKVWVGISSAGFFATEDGGRSWEPRMRRCTDDPYRMPDFHGEELDPSVIFGCVHNAVRAGDDTIYQQNHHGTLRSDDGGRSWRVISGSLPSHFGFPVAVHPADPQTIYAFPLNGDDKGRFPPDRAAAVWRSRDGGDSWEARRDGLPQKDCFFTVLRQAMTTDAAEPDAVYFGTNTGSVFASRDAGGTWAEIARHMPTILSVETLAQG